jgi:hypothetical protein
MSRADLTKLFKHDSAQEELDGDGELDCVVNSTDLDRIFKTNQAKKLASATTLPEVHLSTTISNVLRILEIDGNSCIVVRDFSTQENQVLTRDAIFSRMDVFQAAMKLKDTAQPFSHIVDQLRPLKQVDGESTLEAAVAAMIAADSEEIGVFDVDYGVVRGVITCKSLITFIRYNANLHGSRTKKHNVLGALSHFEDENDDGDQFISRTEKENRNSENVGAKRFSQSQLVAQVRFAFLSVCLSVKASHLPANPP